MRARLAGFLVLLAAAFLLPGGERMVYTSRTHLTCPVLITSLEPTAEFGFDLVTLLNESRQKVIAVNLRAVVAIGNGDEEMVDAGRFVVNLESGEKKRFDVNLGKTQMLEQKARSAGQQIVRVVLFVESAELADGTLWDEARPVLWMPDTSQPSK